MTRTLQVRGLPQAWVTLLLAATALGVYLLVVVGATTSLLSNTVTCPTWPACNGEWVVSLTLAKPALLAAWLHRLAALVVGALMLVSAGAVYRHADRRVRRAFGVAAVFYPVQIVIGAVTAVTGAPLALSATHLVVGMGIFSAVLVAMLWHLETRTPTSEADPEISTTDAPMSISVATDERTTSRSDRSLRARVSDYIELTKPKLMWLLCLVALAAMGLAAGPSLDIETAAATLLGGVLAIGASGTFNNVLERDRDQKMRRTDDRPLVRGRIPVRRALTFGVVLTLASLAVFVAFVNALAAALGLLAILFYSVVYTILLKPNTTQNIVIGGAVGAFPALIGWAAVTNTVGIPAIVLGAIVFLWTPAHFYNLALAYRDDYARAEFPMLPVVRGAATTRRHILLYVGATMLGAVILGAITRLDILYAATITILGGVFLGAIVRLYRERTDTAAFRTFHASNAYLGALLVAIVLDTLIV